MLVKPNTFYAVSYLAKPYLTLSSKSSEFKTKQTLELNKATKSLFNLKSNFFNYRREERDYSF